MNNSWEKLFAECSNCKACELHKTRTNCVFGAGNQNADLLFVGEAPGDNEDKTGTPFVGRAGKLLNEYLDSVGIDRESVYIANILKCRPPKNRDPKPSEEDACIEFLHRQIELLRPKLIVCLGRIAATRLISPDFKVTKEHGQFVKKGNIYFMGTFHPAALLRNEAQKADALSDFQKLREKIKELEINL